MNSWYNLLLIIVPTSVHLCDLEVQVTGSSKPCLILIQLLPNIEQFCFNDLRGYSFAIMYKVSLEHTERTSHGPTQTMKTFLEYKVSLSLALYYRKTKVNTVLIRDTLQKGKASDTHWH